MDGGWWEENENENEKLYEITVDICIEEKYDKIYQKDFRKYLLCQDKSQKCIACWRLRD